LEEKMKNKWKVLTGKTIKEWSEELGEHTETIRCRLVKKGTPYRDGRRFKFLKPDYQPKPVLELAKDKPEKIIPDPSTHILKYSDDTELYMVDDNLSARALNCLQKLGIKTIGDLRSINLLVIDSMHGYGKLTREEIIDKFYV